MTEQVTAGANAVHTRARLDYLVDELQALLVRGKICGPYLLVGHSMGGLIMRRFVQRYPQAVVDLVLIDPAHEEMIARLPADWQAHLQVQTLAAQRFLRGMALLSATGLSTLVSPFIQVDERLPVATQSTVKALQLMDSRYFATLAAEIAAADASFAQMHAASATDWEDKPLVIIEAGKAVNDQPTIDLQLFTPASNLNAELIAQSPQGRLIIAQQSDHYVHYDEPAIVLHTIAEVLDAISSAAVTS